MSSSNRSFLPTFRNDQSQDACSRSPDDTTPLLHPENGTGQGKKLLDSENITLATFEAWVLLKSSLPVIAAYILQNSIQTISIIIVGKTMPHELSIAAFAYMFSTCSGWLIGMGGSTALDTLASAVFTGSSDKHQTGVLLQRCLVILTIFYIPVCLLWLFSAQLFMVLGQDPDLAQGAARFLTFLIPGGFGYIYFEALKKYLQVQGLVHPATYVLLIVSPISAALNYGLIRITALGLLGAPIATGLSYWLALVLLILYTRYIAGYECWGGWNKSCLDQLTLFSRIAAMGIIQLGTEFWAFEIVALIAGRLGKLPLAGQSVLMTADQVLVTIPFGIGVAASVRVGGFLGAKNPKRARQSAFVSVILSSAAASLVCLILIITRNHFAKIFTNDIEVVHYVAEVMPWIALFQVADAVNGSAGGVLRGIGKQHIGAAANLTSYYVIALPLGAWMAFRGLGLAGLWIGLCIGMGSVALVQLAFVLRTNWKIEVERALVRTQQETNCNIVP